MTSSFRAMFPVLSVSLSGNSPPSANTTLVANPVTERPPSEFERTVAHLPAPDGPRFVSGDRTRCAGSPAAATWAVILPWSGGSVVPPIHEFQHGSVRLSRVTVVLSAQHPLVSSRGGRDGPLRSGEGSSAASCMPAGRCTRTGNEVSPLVWSGRGEAGPNTVHAVVAGARIRALRLLQGVDSAFDAAVASPATRSPAHRSALRCAVAAFLRVAHRANPARHESHLDRVPSRATCASPQNGFLRHQHGARSASSRCGTSTRRRRRSSPRSRSTRTGLIVLKKSAERFGWKVGQTRSR